MQYLYRTSPNLLIFQKLSVEQKRENFRAHIAWILEKSDWTQIPGNLSLLEQIEQQELRAAWMELDDTEIDPDTVTIPPYPLMERL